MCIMGNGNDPPARIPSWKFSDEKHESNKQWPYGKPQIGMLMLFF